MDERGSGWQRRALSAPAAPDDADALTTFFGDRCEVEGRLVLHRAIRIGAEFRGAIESSETVTVDAGAAVQADIRARTVEIHGAVVGDVEASREVVISATGRLHGSVQAPSFVIERGAFFQGETRMFRPELAARARAEEEAASAPVEAEPAPVAAAALLD